MRTPAAPTGHPRVHAELRMPMGLKASRPRVAPLMRGAGIQGVSHRRKTRHRPDVANHDDLVQRRFTADGPDRVWSADITQHRAADGWVYCCDVIDAWSRMVVGWSIADHVRSQLIVDALEMAAGSAVQPRPWSTPTGARNTPPGSLGTDSLQQDCSARWGASRPASAMRFSNRSGRRCSASSSIDNTGSPRSSWPARSSNGSRVGKTPDAVTPVWECCPRRSSNPCTPTPSPRQDHLTELSGKPGQAPSGVARSCHRRERGTARS